MCNLPAIIKFDSVTDAGEYGNATCPHCGAKGRYTYYFTVEGGAHMAAMRGCLEHFPQTQIARTHRALVEKAQEYAAKGWTLPVWDVEMIQAVEDCADGRLTLKEATKRVEMAQRRRAQHQQKKFGRR